MEVIISSVVNIEMLSFPFSLGSIIAFGGIIVRFYPNFFIRVSLPCQWIRRLRPRMRLKRLFWTKVLFGAFILSFPLGWKFGYFLNGWLLLDKFGYIFDFRVCERKLLDSPLQVRRIKIDGIKPWRMRDGLMMLVIILRVLWKSSCFCLLKTLQLAL